MAFNRCFETSGFATKGLQSATITITDSTDLIEGVKNWYHSFRNEDAFFKRVLTLTIELMTGMPHPELPFSQGAEKTSCVPHPEMGWRNVWWRALLLPYLQKW